MTEFRHLESRVIYAGHIITVVEGTFQGPDGSMFTRDVVRHPGAVSIVPVQPGPDGPEVVLVRQYRAPVDREILEIPAGIRDAHGEDPEETAQRELQEEVGLRAGRLHRLATMLHSPGFCDEEGIVFLGLDLSPVPAAAQGIEESHMAVEVHPLVATMALVATGRITDAKTIIGCTLALRHLETGEVSL